MKSIEARIEALEKAIADPADDRMLGRYMLALAHDEDARVELIAEYASGRLDADLRQQIEESGAHRPVRRVTAIEEAPGATDTGAVLEWPSGTDTGSMSLNMKTRRKKR